jgi:hydrogenase maturation protein HypF
MTDQQPVDYERWQINVRGIVQGVGFRPFVYGLAVRLGLVGFVLNNSHGVTIEVEGAPNTLAAFVHAVQYQAPPLARVESVMYHVLPAQNDSAFRIEHSASDEHATTFIAPDSATCADCLRELFDPHDRRYRYPFINCTNCGPRLTIVAGVPYDRPLTSMRDFPLCAQCQAEYDDPLNRRFHAQPNACPVCGPQLQLLLPNAEVSVVANVALEKAVQAVLNGQILALKGLGGYHLVCDATNAAAVARLRQRKQREAKPLALMVADLATAQQLCQINATEAALLESPRRPIVLLDRKADYDLPAELAPGQTTLGLMLPYTPLHALLLHDVAAVRGAAPPTVLVMTSGNLSDEPIAYRDADALERLATIADLFLIHNRGIVTRCDDSVTRVCIAGEQLIRRSRGYAPEPLTLTLRFPQPILAYGGHLKNTFCLAREQHAFVSHHIGDLENLETLEAFRTGIAHFQTLFDIQPEVIAYDLHPEYLATKEALAAPHAVKIGVQHHHAHIVSVLAEHGLAGEVIGIAADGTGYGSDGAIWGGEVLVASMATFTRVGHLAYIPLPGGDQAVRQPWRVAAAYLAALYGRDFAERGGRLPAGFEPATWQVLASMIERGINSPPTSSMGRLFDAVAALIGVRGVAHYEGQAAIELEALAVPSTEPYPFAISAGAPFQLSVAPTIPAIIADLQRSVALPVIAGRFHCTIVELLFAACQRVQRSHGLQRVALSGGVFQNRVLLTTLTQRLSAAGFTVYTNQRVPPNDGGLSLGQAAVAAARIGRAGA